MLNKQMNTNDNLSDSTFGWECGQNGADYENGETTWFQSSGLDDSLFQRPDESPEMNENNGLFGSDPLQTPDTYENNTLFGSGSDQLQILDTPQQLDDNNVLLGTGLIHPQYQNSSQVTSPPQSEDYIRFRSSLSSWAAVTPNPPASSSEANLPSSPFWFLPTHSSMPNQLQFLFMNPSNQLQFRKCVQPYPFGFPSGPFPYPSKPFAIPLSSERCKTNFHNGANGTKHKHQDFDFINEDLLCKSEECVKLRRDGRHEYCCDTCATHWRNCNSYVYTRDGRRRVKVKKNPAKMRERQILLQWLSMGKRTKVDLMKYLDDKN